MSLYKDLGISTGPYEPAKLDERFIRVKRKGSAWIRRYIPGEILAGVSIATGQLPEDGDFIGTDPEHPRDQWLIKGYWAEENYDIPQALLEPAIEVPPCSTGSDECQCDDCQMAKHEG